MARRQRVERCDDSSLIVVLQLRDFECGEGVGFEGEGQMAGFLCINKSILYVGLFLIYG